ncbi:GIY-YIG nuclease family protein [Bacillus sp. V3B]|uniref:GIY-YIG nuclease family protein n=1 Tax=Bacillus sp. V3B TaxID=2804915 RepID=UPI002108A8B4|nr:GIY-YIG nuclease family protein [Bacillus sp. V3B]MCQ6274972.1 GIY-YIG nuclease family protein [Bacillus sp. V3B]
MNLKEKVNKLPSSPGVYLMKDSQGSIIYVGKSKNLKKRVQSYFYHSKAHSRKVEKLVKTLKDFDYILTDTEFEAFMLECQLIKELRPFFNAQMKNPPAYTYIVIKMDEEIRSLEITNHPIERKDHLYFGPYTSKNTVEKAIQGIKEFYKINCSNPTKKNSPCLNYTIGLCIGMCLGGSAIDQYNTIIDKIIALLSGSDMRLLEEMKQRMLSASEDFDFENATKYRNCIHSINTLIHKEKMIEFTEENHNIVMIEHLSADASKLFFIKRNKILFSKTYFLQSEQMEQLCTRIKTNMFTYFHKESPPSSLELNRNEIDEAQIIYSYLKNSNCSYLIIPEEWLNSERVTTIDNELIKLLSSGLRPNNNIHLS